MPKTTHQVKSEFRAQGISFSDWARKNNFSVELVYRVLKTNRVPVRGESHKITVQLGIKEPEILD